MSFNLDLTSIAAHGAKRWVVGFSGGIDSHVLLHALASREPAASVHALHVNHGLDPNADGWEAHCRAVCANLAVAFTAIRVKVEPGSGVEARARAARYNAFTRFLEERDVLLLAHHAGDQVETALLKLFRGGSRPGLSGMPRERAIGEAWLARPLLAVTRQQIEAYADAHELAWISDASNEDISMNRNFIRHQVLPLIQARWPGFPETLERELERDEEFTQLVDLSGKNDLDSVSFGTGVSVAGLQSLAAPRRRNAVRVWIESFGLPLPGRAVLSGELEELLRARPDAAPLITWQGVYLRRFDDRLYITGEIPEFDPGSKCALNASSSMDIGPGRLTSDITEGRGLRFDPAMNIDVRFRHGGEKIRIGRNRTLKNIFQERGVPTWLRDAVPLLFAEDELIALPALPAFEVPMCVADHWRAKAAESGLELRFRVPGQPYSH
ncbi:MAG TPA: tRNA lysidine(34) synthetase TilS [Pseudomonadales bacterium]|nr:tRNA lysidine(34) synthetase TilS [Pseudomonadales bacterium]